MQWAPADHSAFGMTNPPLTDGIFFPLWGGFLKGFPTLLASSASGVAAPFGIWFADDKTLYVADEGSGDNTYSATTKMYTNAAAQTTAGLQKWVFNSTTNSWTYAYTLQIGLNLDMPYTVSGLPAGNWPCCSTGCG